MWLKSTFLVFAFSSTLTITANTDYCEPNLNNLHVVYRITKENSNLSPVVITTPLPVVTIIPLITTNRRVENPIFNSNLDCIAKIKASKDYSDIIKKAHIKLKRNKKRRNKKNYPTRSKGQ